jgi:hypothetical protein
MAFPPNTENLVNTAEDLQFKFTGVTKAQRINKNVAEKKARMNGGVAVDEADFTTINPNASDNEVNNFRVQKDNQDTKNSINQLIQDRAAQQTNTYTAGEAALDTVNSVAKGGIALGETLYGVADLASRYNLGAQANNAYQRLIAPEGTAPDVTPSLDSATGGEGSKFFQGLRDSADALYQSDNAAADNERISRAQQEFGVKSDAIRDANTLDGESIWEDAKNVGRKALQTGSEYIENPAVVAQQALEELPQLLTGGVFGKAAINTVRKNIGTKLNARYLDSAVGKAQIAKMSNEAGANLLRREMGEAAADKFMKTAAGKKAAAKASEAAGIGNAAISEAMSNALQTKAEILAMTEKDLVEGSPSYNSLRKQGLSHEDAQMRTSNVAFDIVTALVLPTAGLTSKVTGAAGLEGALFTKGSKVGATILKSGAATAIEGVEEGIQSGTGQVFQNLAKRETGDSTQQLDVSVGEAIGQGVVVGAGTGLTLNSMSTGGALLSGASDDVKSVVKQADKAIKQGAKVLASATDSTAVKTAKATGDASTVVDTTAKDYNPEDAIRVLASEKFFPIRDEANNETVEAYEVRTRKYKDELNIHQREIFNNINNNPADAKELIAKAKTTLQTIKGLDAALGKTDYASAIAQLHSDPAVKEVLLGSMDSGLQSDITVEQAEEILTSGTLNEQETKKVQSFIDVRKSQTQVSAAIRNGEKGKLGLNDYTTLVNAAVSSNNKDAARASLKNLGAFAKGQVAKNKLIQAAYARVAGTDKVETLKVGNRTYEIHKNSNKNSGLIDTLQTETDAVVQTFNSLRDYANSSFTGNVAQGVNDVQTTNTGSTPSGVDNSTGSTRPTEVSGGNEPTGTNGSDIATPTPPSNSEDAAGVAGRNTNDNAVKPVKKNRGRNAAANAIAEAANALETFENAIDPDLDDSAVDVLEAEADALVDTLVTKIRELDTSSYAQSIQDKQNDFLEQADSGVALGNEVDIARDIVRDIRQTDGSTRDLFNNKETSNESKPKTQDTISQTEGKPESQTDTQSVVDGTSFTTNAVGETVLLDADPLTLGSLVSDRAHDNRINDLFTVSPLDNQLNKTVDLFDELDTIENASPQQLESLSRIGEFKQRLTAAIDKIVGLKPELAGDNKYSAVDKNMIQYLMVEGSTNYSDGLDPNTLNVMAIAALKWAATRGKESLNRTPEDIANMLGISENAVSDEVLEYYLNKGIPSYLVTDNMGTDVLQALGLKINKDAPRETRNRMAQSIGGVIFAAMHEVGMLESELADNVPNAVGEHSEESFSDNREGSGKQLRMTKLLESPEVKAEIKNYEDIEDMLEDLISLQNDFAFPSFEAPKSVPKKNQRKTQDLTKSQQSALRKYADRVYNLSENTIDMFTLLGDNVLRFTMGYDFSLKTDSKGVVTSNKTHAKNINGAIGKNNSIDRSIENLNGFVDKVKSSSAGINQDFFFGSVVDNNNRFRMENKKVNPQGDKLHRAAIVMEGWNYMVDSVEKLNFFKLAVGQALGVKVDKLTIEDSVAEVDKLLATPEIDQAIDALISLKAGNLSPDEMSKARRAVARGVTKGGEGAHSLTGLIAMMNYDEDTPFLSNLSIEIDGITNGTLLAVLQFAPGNERDQASSLAKSGVFTDGETSYGNWKKDPSNLDNYEDLKTSLQGKLNSIIAGTFVDEKGEPFDEKLVGLLRPIGNILGRLQLNGDDDYGLVRSVAKNPVLIGNYGAGDNKITQEFVEEVLNRIYAHIEKAVENKDQASLDLVHRELSTVVKFLKPLNLSNALTWSMDKTQESIFKVRVRQTFGKIMNAALKEDFADLRRERDYFNNMLNASNALYRAAYTYESDTIIEEKGFISVADEEFLKRKLAKYMPEIKHGQVRSEDSRNTHIPLNTTELVVTRSARFSTEIDFKETPANHPAGKQRQVYSPEAVNTSNGVKGTVYGIQSTDAAIMADNLLEDYPSMNIYDAVIVNPENAVEAAEALNKSTISISKRAGLYRSAAEALKRSLTGYPKEYTDLAMFYMGQEVTTPEDGNPMDVVREALQNTNNVEVRRAKMFDNIQYTVQYNFEGAGYDTSSEQTLDTHVEQFVTEAANTTNELGSSPDTPSDISYSNTVEEHKVTTSNIQGLMSTLRNSSPVKSSQAHFNYLNELLGDTYNGFITTLKLKVAKSTDMNSGVYDMNTGEVRVNVNTGIQQSTMEMGADEVFSHEIVHSITKSALETNTLLANEVRKLMRQAKQALTPSDFMNVGDTLAEATERYNYIFNNPRKTAKGYSVGVHEFVAFGLTNEKFRSILASKVDPTDTGFEADKSFLGRLANLYAKFLNMFADRIRKVNNLPADQKLVSLVSQLMTNEAAAKQRVFNASLTAKVEKNIQSGLIKFIQAPIVKLLNADKLTKPTDSRLLTVAQALASVGRITIKGEFGEFRKVINEVATRLGATENNLFLALLTEVQGRTQETSEFYQLGRESRKLIDQARADVAASIKQHVRNQFLRQLTPKEETALTNVLLKTDFSSLTKDFTAEELHSLLTDTNYLNQEIKVAQAELAKFGKDRHWFTKQAESLGNFMVTGKFTESFGLMNAHNIARKVGLNSNLPLHAAQAETIIDRLASLTAIKVSQRVQPDDMALVVNLFQEEFGRGGDPEDNGIMFTIMHHMDYKERSLDKLFNGNKTLMNKGYIREIYNPNKSFRVAPEADAELMGKDGFVRVGKVSKDRSDPNVLPMAMYVSDMGALAPWQAGGVSIAGMTSKGTKYFSTVSHSSVPNSQAAAALNTATVKANKRLDAQTIYSGNSVTKEQVTLVPLLDETGQVVDYRYMMEEDTKDLMERNIQLGDVLGSMEGNMKSKLGGLEINDKYVEALVSDYNDNYSKNPTEYALVGLNSDRDDLKELYQMMPPEMRAKIKQMTGQDGIFVRTDMIKLIFGQRKFSIPHYFKEKLRLKEINGTTTNMYMNRIYKILGSPNASKVEQSWQEAIAFVKDTIVVKSVVTLVGNIASNNVLLWSMGVPLNKIGLNQERAVRYAGTYQKNQSRITEIEREITLNARKQQTVNRIAMTANLAAEQTTLMDAQLANPVHDLIEAGVYQSIIEDIDTLDNEFTYKSRIEDWTSPVTSRVPTQLKTMGSYAALTHDTKLYQLLRRSTQLSDFASRFALHEHNLSKGMDVKDSINNVVDTFIDYDLPTHSAIEYLNSVGGVFFTKFFLRIQKVIFNTLKQAPARFFGLYFIQELFGNISDIADSSVMLKDLGYMFKDPIEALAGFTDTHPLINLLR